MDEIELPGCTRLVRTTPEFDRESVPDGLLRAHRVADGVWGRLLVRSGSLRFVFEDDSEHPVTIGEDAVQVIPPGRPHHLELDVPVRFVVEFHRLDESRDPGTVAT